MQYRSSIDECLTVNVIHLKRINKEDQKGSPENENALVVIHLICFILFIITTVSKDVDSTGMVYIHTLTHSPATSSLFVGFFQHKHFSSPISHAQPGRRSSAPPALINAFVRLRKLSMADQPRKSWDDEEAAAPEMEVALKPQISPVAASSTAFEAAALPLSMVLVQGFTMVMLLLSKLALNTGMRPFVLLVYRNLIAAAVVTPLAIIFER